MEDFKNKMEDNLPYQFHTRVCALYLPEMESSGTHFEVLGLEAASPRNLPSPRLEDNTIF